MQPSNASEPGGAKAGDRPAATHEPSGRRPSHWRPDIEGLRAVAVGSVIAAHIGFPYMAGGFVGVDVFFVISGFLITSLLLREIDKTGTVSITRFYARRAVRLLPAAATVLAATLAAAWIWLPRTRLDEIAADAAAAALNVINLRLASEGTNYLNADAEPSPLQHFWSLAVEEQYYVVWPLVLLAVAVLGARFARPGKFQARRNRGFGRTAAIAGFLLVAGAVSFALSATRTVEDPVWSYFGIHTRAWELAAGALVAVAANRLARLPGPAAAMTSWAGLALIVASVFVIDESTPFPGTAAVLPVAGTVLVVAAGCAHHKGGAGLLLGIAPAQYIGKISYGLYLWHWPVIMIAPAALGQEDPRLLVRIALMGLAFVLSVAMFHLVEHPIRTRRGLVQVPSRSLAMGGGLIASALAFSFVAATQPPPTSDGGEAAEINGNSTTVWQLIPSAVEAEEVPANLQPPLETADADLPILYHDECLVPHEQTEVAEDCWYGDPEGDKTMVLFGDSHAAQWFPPLNQLAQAGGYRLIVMTKASCSVPDIAETSSALEREYTECAEWRENAFEAVEELRPEVVLATNSDNKWPIADDPDQAWVDGWAASVERLGAASERVYVLADTLWGYINVPECLAEHLDRATECVYDLDEAVMHPERRERAMAAAGDAGAEVIDPIPWLCDLEKRKCPVVVGNLLVYRDYSHFSASFAAELAPELAVALRLEPAEQETELGSS